MAERAYPEDPAYVSKTKYYHAFTERYQYGKKYTNGMVVLDIPCGSGWGSSFIDNAKEIFGIDISPDAICYARSHFKGYFFQGSMCEIPFANNIFDVALCFEGLEHITKEEGVLFINEIKRVVKKDGLIIGSVPILDEYGKDTGNPYHLFEYPEGYLKILLENNFKIIKYDLKIGGDGPLIFFTLKNIHKNRITILTSGYDKVGFELMLKNYLLHSSPEFMLIVINGDSHNENLDVLNRYNDSRIKIVPYNFKRSMNAVLKPGLHLQRNPWKLKDFILGLLK